MRKGGVLGIAQRQARHSTKAGYRLEKTLPKKY
jgi:hypothetical protein